MYFMKGSVKIKKWTWFLEDVKTQTCNKALGRGSSFIWICFGLFSHSILWGKDWSGPKRSVPTDTHMERETRSEQEISRRAKKKSGDSLTIISLYKLLQLLTSPSSTSILQTTSSIFRIPTSTEFNTHMQTNTYITHMPTLTPAHKHNKACMATHTSMRTHLNTNAYMHALIYTPCTNTQMHTRTQCTEVHLHTHMCQHTHTIA